MRDFFTLFNTLTKRVRMPIVEGCPLLFSNSSHPFDNSQFFGASYNRVFSRNCQFENLA